MKKSFYKIFKNEEGATESVLVTLFLVIIGVIALIGFSTWVNQESDEMKSNTSTQINLSIQDASGQ